MATMYPPNAESIEFRSAAEEKLYTLFSRKLAPEYHIVHSVAWHQSGKRRNPQDGEADFVIIHPDRGILVLEVKGGTITKSGRDYFTTNRYSRREKLQRNPFEQAKDSMYLLLKLVNVASPTSAYANDYRFGYFVWFPDTSWERGKQGWLRDGDVLLLDKSDLGNPELSLNRIFDHFANVARATQVTHPQLSQDAIRAVIELLDERPRPPQWISLPLLRATSSEPLGIAVRQESRRMERLTSDQANKFTQIVNNPRVMIPGAAGTGKTMVALESAYRFAHDGQRVLVLCPGEALADWLRTLANEYWNDGGATHFDIFGLKALCIYIAAATNTSATRIQSLRIDWDTHQAKLSSALRHAGDVLRERHPELLYDVILVDDAHDLNQEIAGPVQKLLREPPTGRLYAFYDLRQRLDFEKAWRWAIGGSIEVQPLTENLRNTHHIYETMRGYQRDLRADQSRGPVGRPHIYLNPCEGTERKGLAVSAADLNAAVLHALDWLIDEQQVEPSDIAVVTCLGRQTSIWARSDQQRIGARYELRWVAAGDQRASQDCQPIALTTMRMCKGREWPIVILAELAGLKRL